MSLNTNEIIRSYEVSVVKAINKVLKGPWNRKQAECGKLVEVGEVWKPIAGRIACKYEAIGWDVDCHVQLIGNGDMIVTRYFFCFRHPDLAVY